MSKRERLRKTVSTVSPWFVKETIEMVSEQCQRLSTGLKPGVNETTFEASKPFRILDPLPTRYRRSY